ncbi:hypothetical protein GF354_01535 [Candidatus Peregrinibacteria bacterium]|nr:hypothetical protein [Candidatus Peregrinibacteria bacterium]
MIKYLKDRSYYEDLYDKGTVEWGLWHEEYFFNRAKDKKVNKLSKEMAKGLCRIYLYFYTGDRYVKREDCINKWMERDRKEDDLLENTLLPEALCFMCGEPMEFAHKHLKTDFKEDEPHVEFIFHCKECEVSSVFNNKGRDDRIPWQCPDCKRRLDIKHKRKNDVITTKEHCNFCGYHHEDKLDLSIKPEVEKSPTMAELKKFREDKLRFCLSPQEGMKYMESVANLERLNKIIGEIKEKDRKPKVKVLSIKEVQKQLKEVLKASGCENVTFSDPDTVGDVVFKFKAIDSRERGAYDARKIVKKAVITKFTGTNWALMSDGVTYRLGILEGRLKGKEYSEDIIY